jgi:hypothetical protein
VAVSRADAVTELGPDRSAHVSGALALQVSEQADVAGEEAGPGPAGPARRQQQDIAQPPVRMTGWRVVVRREA